MPDDALSRPRLAAPLRWTTIAAVAWIAVELFRAGAADFLRLEPCAYLDSLQHTGRVVDPAMLGDAHGRLKLAESLDPRNPIVQEYLSIVEVHRARLVAGDAALSTGYLESAEAHYRAALKLRPNSPYLWAGMALVSSALLQRNAMTQAWSDAAGEGGERRQAFGLALNRAMTLGPGEAYVLRTVVDAVAPHDPLLSSDERALVDDARRRLYHLGGEGSVVRERDARRGPGA